MPNFKDLISFKTRPDDWGIFKVLDRIEAIQKRFAPPMPIPKSQKEDFSTELKSQLYQPGVDDDLFEAPRNPAVIENGEFPTVEKYPAAKNNRMLEDLFYNSADVRRDLVPTDNRKYDTLISRTAQHYGLDENLLRALIKAESGFNPGALSSAGAMGLTQLMPGTAEELGVSNPWDPEQNVDGGARYLRQMLDRFGGDTEKALAAYNAGPGAVETYGGVPPYEETKNYVSSIMNMLGGAQ